MKRQSYRSILNRAACHAGRIRWHNAHAEAMAKARAHIASNPQTRASFDVPR